MPLPLLTPILRPFGLDPTQGYDTAAAGARDAQQQANQLSDLQWQRQMAGLQQAQGYTNQLQQLYNSMYSPGGGAPAAGGLPSGGMSSLRGLQFSPEQSGMGLLLPQQQAPSAPAGGSGGTMLGALYRSTPVGLGFSLYNQATGSNATPGKVASNVGSMAESAWDNTVGRLF